MTERVTGIGAVLFRARDPGVLRSWYAEHLGVTFEPLWEQEAGPTVWAPFEADTDYFGRAEQAWMITFRVGDLDAMVGQLSEAGIEVEPGSEEEYGRFARTWDPEGNPIELWEPR